MEFLKIISEKDNPLFARKEIIVEIKNNSSPKSSEVEKIISERFPHQESLKIDRILPKFGSKIFTIHAKVYKSKKEMEEIEAKPKVKGEKKEKGAK